MTAMESSNEVARRTKRRALFKAVMFPSWPLETRELFQEHVTFISKKENALITMIRSPVTDYWHGTKVERSKDKT